MRSRSPTHRSLRAWTIAGAVLISGLVAGSADAYPRPGRTELISVSTTGEQGTFGATLSAMSDGGRFVSFESMGAELVPGDDNRFEDIFVRDRATSTTTRVSVAADGSQADGRSTMPAMSSDGRWVTFVSDASNLVPGDTNRSGLFTGLDIFVVDRPTGEIERISVSSAGEQANGNSFHPTISDDGRFVAFSSNASNLVPGDTNATPNGLSGHDVFVHDRATGTTRRISLWNDGSEGVGHSLDPEISDDGRYVTFDATAPLVVDDTNLEDKRSPFCSGMDVYVHELATARTERVSVSSDGEQGDCDALRSSISATGRYVAFLSDSSLVPADLNFLPDVFVHDRADGTTERVSVSAEGTEGDNSSVFPSINDDGRYVSFHSSARNLIDGDTNNVNDVFVHDVVTGDTERVSIPSGGGQGNALSHEPAIDGSGRFVSFFSWAKLTSGDATSNPDIFLRDRGPAVGIGELDVTMDGHAVSVSGWATFSGSRVAEADDSGDDGADGALEAGAELTGAAVIYRPERGDLLIRMSIEELPGHEPWVMETPGMPGVLYGLGFTSGGGSFEVRSTQLGTDTSGTASFGLYECGSSCTPVAALSGGLGTTGEELVVAVPLDLLGDETTDLTALRAYSALGEPSVGPLQEFDAVALPDAPLPSPSVRVGVGDRGFDVIADLSDGTFSGSFDRNVLRPGANEVWARACLGSSCGNRSATITLPDESPTLVETTTPPPPLPVGTELDLTVPGAGQFSDAITATARLIDHDTQPLPGRTITFELSGANSNRSFSAITDADGVASITPVLEEEPGTHVLTARFDASDQHLGSADTTTVVVEREDATLSLNVEGKGSKRTLSAFLADEDSGVGIGGRTIAFTVDGETIGAADTAPDGWVSSEIPPRYRGGHRTYGADFAGDAYFLGSTAHHDT